MPCGSFGLITTAGLAERPARSASEGHAEHASHAGEALRPVGKTCQERYVGFLSIDLAMADSVGPHSRPAGSKERNPVFLPLGSTSARIAHFRLGCFGPNVYQPIRSLVGRRRLHLERKRPRRHRRCILCCPETAWIETRQDRRRAGRRHYRGKRG